MPESTTTDTLIIPVIAQGGVNTNVYLTQDYPMATTIEEINGILNVVADNIGDLYEKDAVLTDDIADLQDQIDAIDLTSIIDDAAATGTNLTYSIDKIKTLLADQKTAMEDGASADMNTFKEVEDEVLALQGRVTLLETKVTALESEMDEAQADILAIEGKFDANGKVKAENLPDYIVQGLQYQGSFAVDTDTLPTPAEGEGGNDGHFYTVSVGGSLTLTSGATTVQPGDTLISDGEEWVAIARIDAVTSVNGKTGAVVLVAADIGYTASLASGLTATDVKSALDEIGAKVKVFMDAFGNPADMMTVSAWKARMNTARTDGVTTAV